MIGKFFYKPTQVCFINPKELRWDTGIAYNDEIICLASGEVFKTFHLYQFANRSNIIEPIYPYDEWNDISYEVICHIPEELAESEEPGRWPYGPIKVYD